MAIVCREKERLFEIRTERTSYVFGVNDKGTVQHLHWGEPVKASELAPMLQPRSHSSFDREVDRETEEFGGWGVAHYADGCPGFARSACRGLYAQLL